MPPEIHLEVQKKNVVVTEESIRRVLRFGDSATNLVSLDEKLVKRVFLRMGYNGYLNAESYAKSCVARPNKFLMHVVIQCLGHRKRGYDVATDYMMCAIVALCLSLKFNFSRMIVDNMKNNLNEKR
ncbi:putative SWIRM domain-containing protein [Helianthus anomalus]